MAPRDRCTRYGCTRRELRQVAEVLPGGSERLGDPGSHGSNLSVLQVADEPAEAISACWVVLKRGV